MDAEKLTLNESETYSFMEDVFQKQFKKEWESFCKQDFEEESRLYKNTYPEKYRKNVYTPDIFKLNLFLKMIVNNSPVRKKEFSGKVIDINSRQYLSEPFTKAVKEISQMDLSENTAERIMLKLWYVLGSSVLRNENIKYKREEKVKEILSLSVEDLHSKLRGALEENDTDDDETQENHENNKTENLPQAKTIKDFWHSAQINVKDIDILYKTMAKNLSKDRDQINNLGEIVESVLEKDIKNFIEQFLLLEENNDKFEKTGLIAGTSTTIIKYIHEKIINYVESSKITTRYKIRQAISSICKENDKILMNEKKEADSINKKKSTDKTENIDKKPKKTISDIEKAAFLISEYTLRSTDSLENHVLFRIESAEIRDHEEEIRNYYAKVVELFRKDPAKKDLLEFFVPQYFCSNFNIHAYSFTESSVNSCCYIFKGKKKYVAGNYDINEHPEKGYQGKIKKALKILDCYENNNLKHESVWAFAAIYIFLKDDILKTAGKLMESNSIDFTKEDYQSTKNDIANNENIITSKPI